MNTSTSKTAWFRFYEELNDFLPARRRKETFPYAFNGSPSVKDVIEALGIPHTEVDMILANGESVCFEYRLQPGDRIAVYPLFESFDIRHLTRLRPEPLRTPRFVLDVHLGKLARLLRLLGFDTEYSNSFSDEEIVDRAAGDPGRTVLTRDLGILKHGAVTRGYWVRSTIPDEQIAEVVTRFHLDTEIMPFHRCLSCNGTIERIDSRDAVEAVPAKVAAWCNEFYRCGRCGKVYWKGSHVEKMLRVIDRIRTRAKRRHEHHEA